MFTSQRFIDSRTGEIVTQFNISEIAHFDEYNGPLQAGDVDQRIAGRKPAQFAAGDRVRVSNGQPRPPSPLKVIVTSDGKRIASMDPSDFMRYMDRPRMFLSDLVADFNKSKERAGEPERVCIGLNKGETADCGHFKGCECWKTY